jgi:hypothetical protein
MPSSRPMALVSLVSLVACRAEAPGPTLDATGPSGLAVTGSAPPSGLAPGDAAPAAQPAAGAPSAPTAACLSAELAAAHRDLRVDFAARKGDTLEACGDLGDARACLTLDLATGRPGLLRLSPEDLDHLAPWPPGFDDGLRLDDARPVTRVCTPATQGCKDLHADRATTARFSADRSRSVLTVVNAEGPEVGGKTLFVHDVPTQAQTLALPLPGASVGDCSFAAFAGPSLLVGVGPCEAPFPTAFLADPATGARLAPIGGETPSGSAPGPAATPVSLRDGQFVPLGGGVGPDGTPSNSDRWAFRAADGATLLVQDVRTGTVEARIPLPTPPSTARSEAWLLTATSPAGPSLHLVSQVTGAPVAFVAVDLTAKTATPLPLPPTCP